MSTTKPLGVSQIEPAASRWMRSQAGEMKVAVDCAMQVVEDGVSAEALDRVLQLDVPPVDRQREPRDEARLEHDAERSGRALFRRQVRVTAEQAVVLAGRVRRRRLTDGQALRETAVSRLP